MSSRGTNPMLGEIADELVELLVQRGVMRSCPDCAQWEGKGEFCRRYQMRPPATVIAKGCEEFDPEIPF